MQRIATILIVYLSVACAMPAFQPLVGCSGSTCSTEQTCNSAQKCGSEQTLPAGRQEKEVPTKNTCPFTVCCCNCCTVCYHQEEKIEFTSVLTGTEKIKVEHEVSTSSYSNECWHPPEMA